MTYNELNTLLSEVTASLSVTTNYLYSPDDQINTYQGNFPLVVALPFTSEVNRDSTDLSFFAFDEFTIQLAFLEIPTLGHDTNNDDKLDSVQNQWTRAKEFVYRLYNDDAVYSISTSGATILSHTIDPLHVYISNHTAIGVALTMKYRVKSTFDYCDYE